MKYFAAPLSLAVAALALADHRPAASGTPAKLLEGLGSHHHPVSTRSKEA
jgi:hypothetical protein